MVSGAVRDVRNYPELRGDAAGQRVLKGQLQELESLIRNRLDAAAPAPK